MAALVVVTLFSIKRVQRICTKRYAKKFSTSDTLSSEKIRIFLKKEKKNRKKRFSSAKSLR